MTTDLITRIEQAGEDEQRKMLIATYAAIFGQEPANDQWYSNDIDAKHRGAWFLRKLDAQAYLSAAEMLVPDGARFEFVGMEDGRGAARILWPGEATLPKLEPLCATPALALAAACLKAHGEMQS